jgi:hypothetical protein
MCFGGGKKSWRRCLGLATKFNLGDRVMVRGRVIPLKTSKWEYGHAYRTWKREDAQREGIIAGVRTVQEGKSELMTDEGWVFAPTKRIKTYLVAVNLRDIWHVLPEDLELKKASEHV